MSKNIATNGIETIDQLIIPLTKIAAAYRKSYKFCGRVNTGLQITADIMGCSAALALVPAILICVAVVGAIPPIVTIIINILEIEDKKTNYSQNASSKNKTTKFSLILHIDELASYS